MVVMTDYTGFLNNHPHYHYYAIHVTHFLFELIKGCNQIPRNAKIISLFNSMRLPINYVMLLHD